MALRRPPTTFSDQITDADIGADSIGTSELKNDAVETANIKDSTGASDGITAAKIATDAVIAAKIATGAVVADGIGAGAVVAAGIGAGAVVEAKLGASAVTSAKLANDTIEVKPHIKPGMLYPAMKDTGGTVRQTDGVTAVVARTVGPAGSAIASSLYGTVQSDGKMYYYTDIKGSKPIKDPRIGAHFGSQRHKFKSLQLLEQETATHSKNVYSVDGREWVRATGNFTTNYNAVGNYIQASNTATDTIEIVGYFTDANILVYTDGSSRDTIDIVIDGGTPQSNDFSITVETPLRDRFVDAAAVLNIAFNGGNPSLGIHTLELNQAASNPMIHFFGVELIAQDTTSTTTKSQIQIQPQNVVSYGKRFAIDDTALHYNPFAFKTDGATAWASGAHNGTSWPVGTGSSHNIDTATSLGLDKWLHSSNYYKPYNGGRVVIWVDSSGNIKTSVTVMPPNARSIKNATITPKTNASATNDTYLPTFEAGVATVFESAALSEVAKTYYWREFGNGAANQGNNTSGTYQDASMLNAADDIAYVMDDGLTSLSGQNVASATPASPPGIRPSAPNKSIYITFIGSGIGGVRYRDNSAVEDRQIWAQNLPYGTHILKLERDGSNYQRITVDGVLLETNSTTALYLVFGEQSIYQPKRPPIPEDAVVLADYMLMADFVSLGASNNNDKRAYISKGVRRISATRDVFYDNSAWVLNVNVLNTGGFGVEAANQDYTAQAKIAFFGDKVVWYSNDPVTRFVDGTCTFSSGTKGTTVDISSTNDAAVGAREFGITDGPMSTTFTADSTGASNSYGTKNLVNALDLHTPIHTSSHYQTFETPFLHELVGGDRNMEQTNLVVTGDGKTWDGVTRDTSYLGNTELVARVTSSYVAANSQTNVTQNLDKLRGVNWNLNCGSKNFIPAYDRFICLKAGQYTITYHSLRGTNGTNDSTRIFINGIDSISFYSSITAYRSTHMTATHSFNRGDYFEVRGAAWDGAQTCLTVTKI